MKKTRNNAASRGQRSVSEFTEDEQSDLQQIARKIVEEMDPVAIYYYGSRAVRDIRRSYFTAQRDDKRWSASYHLLVIVDHGKLPGGQHQLLGGTAVGRMARAHMIVHSREYVQAELQQGNFFFSHILRASVCLYDRMRSFGQRSGPGRLLRALPAGRNSGLRSRRYLHEAGEKLKEAADFLRRDAAYDCVACLRPALACCLRAVISAATGYDIGGDNWERLVRFTESFTRMPPLFFTVSTEERRLYHLVTRPDGSTDPLTVKITVREAGLLLRRARLLRRWAEEFLRDNDTLLSGRKLQG